MNCRPSESPAAPPTELAATLPAVLRAPVNANIGLLLESRIPARLAWVARDTNPRLTPIWFHWTGQELVMATFAGARKLADLTEGTVVAVTIDTAEFPYRSLTMRGALSVTPTTGLVGEYRTAASRYLGPAMAERWLGFLGDPDQVKLALRPTSAIASDMAADSPFMGT